MTLKLDRVFAGIALAATLTACATPSTTADSRAKDIRSQHLGNDKLYNDLLGSPGGICFAHTINTGDTECDVVNIEVISEPVNLGWVTWEERWFIQNNDDIMPYIVTIVATEAGASFTVKFDPQ